ncbi:MAG TPA: polysaccharide biosynthesis tyrosine autokinase [Xanthobacteraceae bacterium]|nr:polysaccharide biosynthesis tyrosine autokinase [Xanthobacteraceae bacterium]
MKTVAAPPAQNFASNMDEQSKMEEGYFNRFRRPDSYAELLEQCAGFFRRQYRIFIIAMSCSIGLGAVYLITTPPRYTARAELLIDSNKVHVLQPHQQALGDVPLDSDQVETQVEVLKSEKIALAVINDQNLTEDPEFLRAEKGVFGRVLGYLGLGSSHKESAAERTRDAVQTFLDLRTVTRIGRTYALALTYTAFSPERAAAVVNAIGDAYIRDQIEAKSEATRRASDWLQDRIKELETRAVAADRAVLQFKEANNIVDVGDAAGAAGRSSRLIADQQLAEISTQLVNARVATSEAQARLERINEIMSHDVGDGTVADSLKDEVIVRLRNQYLDLATQEGTWSTRYGPDHEATVNLRREMQEVRRSISNELGRIAASYKSDYEIAKSREDGLEQKFETLVAIGQTTNRDRLGLDELESSAKVYHTIYGNFLQLYREAIQQQSFPITEARMLSPASPPRSKSSPLGSAVLSGAAVLGALVALGLAILREVSDAAFRTARQVEDALRAPCLARLPSIGPTGPLSAEQHRNSSDVGPRLGHRVSMDALAVSQEHAVSLSDGLLRYVIEQPVSAFAQGLRAVKIAAELSGAVRQNKVIGITSATPNEGKSTIACNIAELMADAGKRVILIDADLRKPTLVKFIAPRPDIGLSDVLEGKADLERVIRIDAETGLSLLPSILDSGLIHSDEVLSSAAFKRLIEQLRGQFDYVIIDLPPLGPVVDVRAAAPSLDTFVFVVEWGHTPIKLAQGVLNAAPEVSDRLLGIVLNKVDIKAVARYEHPYTSLYGNNSYYERYRPEA